jgi:hypothetical protein
VFFAGGVVVLFREIGNGGHGCWREVLQLMQQHKFLCFTRRIECGLEGREERDQDVGTRNLQRTAGLGDDHSSYILLAIRNETV